MRQYDPVQVQGSFAGPAFGGVDILDGAVAGDFIAASRDNPTWAREFDRFGNCTRVKNNNMGATIPVTLSASSPTNQTLSLLQNRDQIGEAIVGTLLLRDLNGTTVITCTGAFLNGPPATITYGQERGSRVWTFECERIDIVLGGHDPT